jgi:very-short-patch-repair endonuclease
VREELAKTAHIARLAANQHGVVAVAQLERLGTSRQSLTRLVKAGRLHRIHRGVYAVGHRGLSEKGSWMAAVLACGPKAVLSHTSAAALWQLRPQRGVTHVTVSGSGRCRQGIRVHRSGTLTPGAVTRKDGIPVTSPSRTLIDLRRLLPQPQFAAALREAEYLGLAIDPILHPDHTRSELEARFLALLRRHRLPKPEVNVRVGPYIADFLWPANQLIVELDGFRAHSGRGAFERDRARDVELRSLGYDVIRLTWAQVNGGRRRTAARLRAFLRK